MCFGLVGRADEWLCRVVWVFFFQAEDGIRDRSPSRGLGDVYKRQDYFLSKYIEIKRTKESAIQYISLYKDDENKIQCETSDEFELLEHNTIMDTFRQLYREEIGVK